MLSLPNIDATYESHWRKSLSDQNTQQKFLGMLAKVQMLSHMSETFRSSICRSLIPVEYQVGEVIFKQGERNDWLGILLCGKLECQIQAKRQAGLPKPHKIGRGIMPGGTIGDMNVLGLTELRTMTVIAEVKSTVLILPRDTLEYAASGPKDVAMKEEAKRMQEKLIGEVDTFCNLPVFQRLGFSRDFVKALFENAERRLLYPGHVLMREGSQGDEMFVLDVGQASIEQGGEIVSTVSDGAPLGELAVLGPDKRRRATVVCTSLSLVTVLKEKVMQQVLEDFPNCRSAFHRAYINTLVRDNLFHADQEIKQLNRFYGKVHPLNTEELIDKGFASTAMVQAHKTAMTAKFKDRSRPSTARKYFPTKVPSRPSTALGVRGMSRGASPELWERRCYSSCQ